MLLFLKNVHDGNVFYLAKKDQFLVGRKDCDFLIQNDQSISRKHAVIYLKDNKITVKDCGSKYNTFCKGEKLEPNLEIEITIGDEVQFGVSDSVYSLQKYEFITTGTRLNNNVKAKLITDLSVINGQYVDQWTSECTHLTVEEVTLTIKCLHALVDEKPIVKPTYWTKFAERVHKSLPPPNIDHYNNPPVAEVLLNKIDLKPNPLRKILFKGKVFIFPKEKDKKRLEDVIKKCGGTSISWEKNPLPLKDIEKSPKEFLVIQTPDMSNDRDLNNVIKMFSKQGKRTIPLQEIATSIVHCSCERDCNPNFNRIEQVFPLSGPNEPTQSNALATDSESQCLTMQIFKNEEKGASLTIPDTFEDKLHDLESEKVFPSGSDVCEGEVRNSSSLKRLNEDESQTTPLKKTKMDSENKMRAKRKVTDQFLSKDTSPKKRISSDNKQNKCSDEEADNPFAFLNKNKTSKTDVSPKNNPFQIIKKENSSTTEVSKENPFKLSLGNKKRTNEDLADRQCKKKKNDNFNDRIFSSTKIENISLSSTTSPRISRVKNEMMNTTWMSKNATKSITDTTENTESHFDIEMKQFIDQFKNTVVVEVMKIVPKREKLLRDHLDCSKDKVNFKRFKKVMPLKPSNKITRKVNFTAVDPADTTGIVDSRREFHNSDDEAEGNLKVKKKAPRKFLI